MGLFKCLKRSGKGGKSSHGYGTSENSSGTHHIQGALPEPAHIAEQPPSETLLVDNTDAGFVNPAVKEDLSQKIWNDAYDEILADEKKLATTYVKALEAFLKDEKADGTHSPNAVDVSAELSNRTRRQEFMEKLVEKGKARVEKTAKVSRVIGTVAGTILKAKPAVDVVMTIPQAAPAAIPWAGVCVGLQILSNPMDAFNSNLAGTANLATRMEWYCALVEHLLSTDDTGSSNIDFKTVLEKLEPKVRLLYKAILIYQMKSTCSYYRNQIYNFVLQFWNADDWVGAFGVVENAEKDLLEHWDRYNDIRAAKVRDDLRNVTNKMEKHLGNIHQTLEAYLDQQRNREINKDVEKCLSELLLRDPLRVMNDTERGKERLIKDTYDWILKDGNYLALTNWGDSTSPECQFLWIKGDAGTGKTMFLIGIIRQLSDRLAALAPSLSYFFFQSQGKSDVSLDNASAALRSLMWMLFIQQPQLIKHVLSEQKMAKGKYFTDKTAAEVILLKFRSMLEDVQPVYFIVDALDECDHYFDLILEFMSMTLFLSDKVKWLVSSRPEVDLLQKLHAKLTDLHGEDAKYAGALFELNIRDQKDRVDKYIKGKWQGKMNWKYPDTFDDKIMAKVADMVSQRAEDNLLWVSLVFKDFPTMHGNRAVDRIKEYPSGLRKLYDHKMLLIENQDDEEDEEPRRLHCCNDVLVVMSHAYRPISLSELYALLPWSHVLEPAVIVDQCRAFLTLNDETVSMNHKSAKDYLMSIRSRLKGRNIQGHADVARVSIEAMNLRLKRNIFDLKQYEFKSTDMEPPDSDPLAPIAYSCEFWVDHLRSAEDDDSKHLEKGVQNEQVFAFLKEHFLHWLQSLSLLGKLVVSVQSISQLEILIQERQDAPGLLDLVRDARRFITYHKHAIEMSPLQTYVSALVFSPIHSLTRDLFKKEEPKWVTIRPTMADRWSACLQTLEGHNGNTVWSVAFSPNDKLASCADDCTVQLWDVRLGERLAFYLDDDIMQLSDAEAGKPCATPKTHEMGIRSIAFSRNGKRLASCSNDKTVKLWDFESGKLCRTLEGHSSSVKSVAFSPDNDSKWLVSCSDDKKVQLWDAESGELLRTLQGHRYEVWSVAFSPNGKWLASCSKDTIIKVWNVESDKSTKALGTLRGHKKPVKSVVFSPDGKWLASCSHDWTVKLWNATEWGESRKASATLKAHEGAVLSAAFSTDSKWLASCSADKTVKLWDVESGKLLTTLEGHNNSVNSVAFSPDEVRLLVSCSTDGTVKLWDIAEWRDSGKASSMLKGHSSEIKFVAFSPNGKRLASCSADKTVKLWDTVESGESGEALATFEGHDSLVFFVAFSPDGKWLASCSGDCTVKLWKAEPDKSSKALATLKGHTRPVRSVAFSPVNGQWLASCSDDCTVKLWKAESDKSSKALATLTGHERAVLSAAFSLNGKWLASCSHDCKIKMWDVESAKSGKSSKALATLHGHNGTIRSVAFSPDSVWLASSSDDRTIKLWKAEPGESDYPMATLEIGLIVDRLYFSVDGSHLNTSKGIIQLGEPFNPAMPIKQELHGLFVSDQWVMLGSEKLLWLPPEYRATHYAVQDLMIAVGNMSGQVKYFQFHTEHLSRSKV